MTSGPKSADISDLMADRARAIEKRERRLVRLWGPEAAQSIFRIDPSKYITAPLPSATMQQNPAEIQTLTNKI